jgi:flavin-dependent dehydrogenase
MLANGDKLNTFYFADGLVRGQPGAFQVLRSRFDHLLLDHARKTGADVREGHTVRELTVDAGIRATIRDESGVAYEIRARFFADATGRDAFLATRGRTRQLDPGLKHVALYAHFEGVQRDEGRDSGNTISIPIRGGWIWFIPLAQDITSIGVVVDAQMFKASGASTDEYYESVLAQVPVISARMASARRQSVVHTASDFSYTTPGLYGDRFIVLGDAGFFLDPIFSSGVHLAISSGIYGSEAIDRYLTGSSSRWRRNPLRQYERRLRSGQRLYFRFIHGWYSPGFLEVLLSPTRRFQLVEAIVSVLAGSASGSLRVRIRVELFFLIVWLNQRFGLVPAIDRSQMPPLA